MSTIQPHQQRVIEEKADLDAKIAKLADFIVFSPTYKSLGSDEKDRLNRQHAAMRAYSGVLRERIEAFES